MHYYQHNIADYRKDTGHLTLLEHGIYRQLLDEYYLNEKPIETQQVIRRLSIKTQEEKEALNNVLNDFFQTENNGETYTQNRCDAEIEGYKCKADISRENGKLGGRPKKSTTYDNSNNNNKPKKTQQVILDNPDLTQKKANQELNNSVTNKPLNNKTIAKKANAFVLPDWINQTHWDVWHESPKRKNATNNQKKLAIDKLAKWKEQGIDYEQALENAAMGGYQGLFEPNKPKQSSNQVLDKNKATTDAAYEKLFGNDAEKDITHESARL